MAAEKVNLLKENKEFLRLFTSYSVSMLGRWLDLVAIMILFGFTWNANPLIIALIPVVFALPHAIFSQFAGVLTDRFNKVKLMIFSDISVCLLSILLLFVSTPLIGLILLFIRSSFTIVHFPAQQSIIKEVVKEEHIVGAVTLNGMINEFTKMMGPLLGSSLAAFFSPKVCILINAIAYLISAMIVWSLKERETKEKTVIVHQEQQTSMWSKYIEGWKAVFTSRILLICISYSVIGYMAIQMTDVQLTVLFREVAATKPELLGWVMAASGLGAFISMFLMKRFFREINYRFVLGGSYILIGFGFGGMGFLSVGAATAIPIALGMITGGGVGLFSMGMSYILQRETTKENIGRVSGIYNSLTNTFILIAPIAGGLLVELWNVYLIYRITGLILIVFSFIFIFTRNVFLKGNNKKEREAG
ncbi:MFS transporter [Oceanobacillus jeddahense]|uniref:MFS transporter n=1 Tax=Oceanobacillus jeddahense TaxID=1462527 RepID=A0ABY5JZV5_9BACI|nr:MFS transporter [Oceanobacillus jeddahense]UUI04372.1 MFS transporter [Oceanobacillus jeddahense]